MPDDEPRTRPGLPGRILWAALGLLAAAVALAVVVALFGAGTSSSGGGSGGAASAGAAAPPAGSGRCPAKESEVAASTRAGAKQAVVPPGSSSVMLCRYGPPREDRLLASRVIRSRHQTNGLTRELNALPKGVGVYACPLDIGPRLLAVFQYPRGADNPVTVDLSGCSTVSNGHLHRLGMGRPVIGRIAALVPSAGGQLPGG